MTIKAERISNYLATVLEGRTFELPLGKYTTFFGKGGYRIVPSQPNDRVRFSNVYMGKSGKVIFNFRLFSSRPHMRISTFKEKPLDRTPDFKDVIVDDFTVPASHIEVGANELFKIPEFCSFLGNVTDESKIMPIQAAIEMSGLNYFDFMSRARSLPTFDTSLFWVKEGDEGVTIYDAEDIERATETISKESSSASRRPTVETTNKTNSNWGLFS